MTSPWRQLPQPARAIAVAVTDAVDAARSLDLAEFEHAATQLAGQDPQRVGLVLGAVVRSLLEDLHPDGLSGDDVRAVLEGSVSAAITWFPDVDANILVVLLTGALGVHQPDEDTRPPSPMDVARHAPLLTADLLAAAGRPLTGYLAASFAEIARAETVEPP